METFFALADQFTRTALHGRANSALPNAPVEPYVERRSLRNRAGAYARGHLRRPLVEIRRARYTAGCPSP
jgi:hypothetical protein